MSQFTSNDRLRNEPDLYLQISSISVGIPQINQLKTNYVDHKLNGLIINDMSELIMAIDFYLLNLKIGIIHLHTL